jgi:hypothetical protein
MIRRQCTLSLLFILLMATAAPGQPTIEPPNASTTRLEATPIEVQSLGLSLRLPAGCKRQIVIGEGQAALDVTDGAKIPLWRFQMQEMEVQVQSLSEEDDEEKAKEENIELTLEQIAQSHIEQLRAGGTEIIVLSNEMFICRQQTGRLIFLRQQLDTERQVILGYLILPIGRNRLMMVSILTVPDDFENTRNLLEASFQTIALRSATDRAAEDQALLSRGLDFLKSLDENKLRTILDSRQCLRIYQPADNQQPEREIGYSVVHVLEASPETLNDPAPAIKGETTGLLVHVLGRIAAAPDRNLYEDYDFRFWVAWDLSAEQWSSRATRRQGDASMSSAESGIRLQTVGDPRPVLQVIRSEERTRSRDEYDWQVPDAYLSQALAWVLGPLLPRDPTQPIEMGYYFCNSRGEAPALSLRLDRWTFDDTRQAWTLTTQLGRDAPAGKSIYDRNGNLIRQHRADGTVIEPIAPDELERLWIRKGLDPGNRRR